MTLLWICHSKTEPGGWFLLCLMSQNLLPVVVYSRESRFRECAHIWLDWTSGQKWTWCIAMTGGLDSPNHFFKNITRIWLEWNRMEGKSSSKSHFELKLCKSSFFSKYLLSASSLLGIILDTENMAGVQTYKTLCFPGAYILVELQSWLKETWHGWVCQGYKNKVPQTGSYTM